MSTPSDEPKELDYESATDPATQDPDPCWTRRMLALTLGIGPLTTAIAFSLGAGGDPYTGFWAFFVGALAALIVSVPAVTVGVVLLVKGRSSRSRGAAAGLLIGGGLCLLLCGGCFALALVG